MFLPYCFALNSKLHDVILQTISVLKKLLMQQPHKPVYFPNLNGVRFIAAFSVLIHHTEQIKYLMGLENNYGNFFIKNLGKLGVGLFFVLSGFLVSGSSLASAVPARFDRDHGALRRLIRYPTHEDTRHHAQ